MGMIKWHELCPNPTTEFMIDGLYKLGKIITHLEKTFGLNLDAYTSLLIIYEDVIKERDKYRWHDINENNLPPNDHEVLVLTDGAVTEFNSQQRVAWVHNNQWIYRGGTLGEVDDGYVIAWRLLEPYDRR